MIAINHIVLPNSREKKYSELITPEITMNKSN